MPKSVSILLGAGFSAPKGYPIGNQLNEFILACNGTEFGFSSDGKMVFDQRTGGAPVNRLNNSFQSSFEGFLFLRDYYHKEVKPFDYEEFFDFIIQTEDKELIKNASLSSGLTLPSNFKTSLRSIYNQLVSYFLKDGDGNHWYPDQLDEPQFEKYSAFIDVLRHFIGSGIVNIHSLNHDILLDSIIRSIDLAEKFSDGFVTDDSEFFGLDLNNDEVTLPKYIESYVGQLNLFKLHGSLDYIPYYKGGQGQLTPSNYLKTYYGIADDDLKRRYIDEEGNEQIETCWINYHTDFLTGTTSKIERYKEPLLYKKLFQYFRSNLEEAERLIIVGYGAKDEEVNRMLLEHFDCSNKPSFIIDPYAGDAVKELQKNLGAKLIETQLEDLTIEELT